MAYIRDHGLNEVFDGDLGSIGLILQGGLYNTAIRRLQALGLADAFGASRIPLLVLNVVHPLVPGPDRGILRRKRCSSGAGGR